MLHLERPSAFWICGPWRTKAVCVEDDGAEVEKWVGIETRGKGKEEDEKM